jgi:transcription elongation GreA/GreB family factor
MTKTFGKEEPFIVRLGKKIQRVSEVEVLPETIERAKRRLGEIEERLRENTKTMAEMGRDGDMMDDPLLHNAQEQDNSLVSQRAILRRLTEIAKPKQPDRNSKVGYGKRIVLDFFDGKPEKVMFGNGIDAGFGEDVLSDESPVGKAVLGKTPGEEVNYTVGERKLRVKVAKVE